ncbi:MAG: response regulator [Flavobacteriales bacterium]|nr:response regulator [Flavobacteriales bacterium]
MSTERINVLYLDDEPSNLVSFMANFRRDFNVFTTSNPGEALRMVDVQSIHVVICDHKMPQLTGVQFFERLSVTHPDIIRILLTGYTDVQTVIDAINQGQVYRYFAKPMDPEEIRDTIKSAYEFFLASKKARETYTRLLRENEQLEFMLRQKLLN